MLFERIFENLGVEKERKQKEKQIEEPFLDQKFELFLRRESQVILGFKSLKHFACLGVPLSTSESKKYLAQLGMLLSLFMMLIGMTQQR